MIKTVSLVVIGCVAGAAGTYVLVGADRASDPAGSESVSFLDSLARRVAGAGTAGGRQNASVAERLAAYGAAAAKADAGALAADLERAASAPLSAARDLELDAALARLAELDPALALQRAESLGLAKRFAAAALQSWAELDPAAALAALSGIRDSAARRAAALALLDVIGDDAANAERIAAALPASDRAAFTVERIAALAERDAYGAFRNALALADPGVQRDAMLRLAAVWARQDAIAALSQAGLLTDTLQREYRIAVGEEWARLDSASFLAYLETRPDPDPVVSAGLQWVLAGDPERVLRVAEGMSGPMGESLRSSAMFALAERDPLALIPRAEAMPPGEERNRMLQVIGNGYAQRDPEAALAWAASLSPPVRDVQMSVISGVVSADLDLAFELLSNPRPGVDQRLLESMISSRVSRDPASARELAVRLLARESGSPPSPSMPSMLDRLLQGWAQQDPDGALDWMLANVQEIDAAIIGNVAQRLASRDPAWAADYVDRMPSDLRATWIAQVAGPYARYDPSGALDWLARYRGQAGYEQAFRQVVMQSAQSDPRGAAELLAGAGPELELGAAPVVAQVWARQEPEAAVRWAEGLSDPRARESAMVSAVAGWAATDVAGAERWVLGMARGGTRDQALGNVIMNRGAAGPVDRRLLDAYSSAAAREQGLTRVVPSLARQNAAEARALVDEHITDPMVKEQMRETIDTFEGNSGIQILVR